MSALDPSLVWASLSPLEQRVFAQIVDELGLDTWTEIPALRTLLPLLTTHRNASAIRSATDLSLKTAYRQAARALGADDDARDSVHCSGDGVYRVVRRWLSLAAKRRR